MAESEGNQEKGEGELCRNIRRAGELWHIRCDYLFCNVICVNKLHLMKKLTSECIGVYLEKGYFISPLVYFILNGSPYFHCMLVGFFIIDF